MKHQSTLTENSRMTDRGIRQIAQLLVGIAILTYTQSAHGQLRPLPEATWTETGSSIACGMSGHGKTRLALAGEEGRLLEVGACTARFDLVGAVLQISGTSFRHFTRDLNFRYPQSYVLPVTRDIRTDAGDWVIETLVPIITAAHPAVHPWLLGLRFGARLPTTDNTVGMERDQTDFHGALMFGARHRDIITTLEAGVGINGSISTDLEQQDMLIYSGFVHYQPESPFFQLRLGLVGQAFWLNKWSMPGNENLGEARLGARIGNVFFLDVEAMTGYTDMSPLWGLAVLGGVVIQ